MSGEPAEYWSRRYMAQSWGGKDGMAYRRFMGLITRELNSPMERCPSCEEPGYPTILAWPERSQQKNEQSHKRYGLCILCGHKFVIFEPGKARSGHYLSPEQCDEIEELHLEAGWGTTELAKRFICYPGTIRNILKRRGHKLKHGGSKEFNNITHQELEEIGFLYSRMGWTQERIGEHMGRRESSIGYYCRRMGFKRREEALKDIAAFDANRMEYNERKRQSKSSTAAIH